MTKKTIRLKELKQSKEILEIRSVNPVYVSRYRQAMRAGDKFPEMEIEKGSNIIVKGNTRFGAYLAEYGEDHKVTVIVREYPDQAAMVEDSIRDNARHGVPLDGYSRKMAVTKLSDYGRTPEQIASLLGVPVKRVEQMGDEVCYVIGGNKKTSPMPFKRGPDIRNKTITQEQYDRHISHDRGVPARHTVNQLIHWLRDDWINLENEENVKILTELAELLEEKLGVTA